MQTGHGEGYIWSLFIFNPFITEFGWARVFIRLTAVSKQLEVVDSKETFDKRNSFVIDFTTMIWCLGNLAEKEFLVQD